MNRPDLSIVNELETGQEITIGRAVYYVTDMSVDGTGTRHLEFTPRDTAAPPLDLDLSDF